MLSAVFFVERYINANYYYYYYYYYVEFGVYNPAVDLFHANCKYWYTIHIIKLISFHSICNSYFTDLSVEGQIHLYLGVIVGSVF